MRRLAAVLLLSLAGQPATATTSGDVPDGAAVGFVLQTGPESDGSREHLSQVILALRLHGLVYLAGGSDDLHYAGPEQGDAIQLCSAENPLGAALDRLGWSCNVAPPARPMPLPSQ